MIEQKKQVEKCATSGGFNMREIIFPNIRSRFPRLLMIMPAVAFFGSIPARADMIIAAGNVFANSPSSSNTLEINLTNTGPSSLSLGGFSFEIVVTDPHITFTSATNATVAPYVFAGHSLFGPIISTSAPGQLLDVSDLWDVFGGGATVAAGATVGLGHVFFDVSAGDSSGVVPVTLSLFPATSLSDSEGGNITVNTLTNGSVTISAPNPVPEPNSIFLLGMMVAGLIAASARKKA